MQRGRLGVLVAGAAGTAMLSLLAMVVEQAVGGGRGMRAELDLVTRMNGYTPNGVVYSEGQMPLGLGAASGICPWGFCPQRGDGVEVNPREAASSPYAVRWTGFDWQTYDDAVNVYQPSPCLAAHLGSLDAVSMDEAAAACEGGLDLEDPDDTVGATGR